MAGEKKIIGIWRPDMDAAPAAEEAENAVLPGAALPIPYSAQPAQRHPNDRRDQTAPSASDANAVHEAPPISAQDFPVKSANSGHFARENQMDASSKPSRQGYAPLLAAGGALLWGGFTLFAATDGFSAAPILADWPALIAAMTAPIALGLIIWLIASQSSPSAHARFTRMTAELRAENEALGQSMTSLGEHLAHARQQLSEQASIVQQLGLDAVLRLNDSSEKLAAHAAQIAHANETLSGSADNAMQRMNGLLNGLPRVDDVAQRLTQNFRDAGLAAHQHGAQLEAQIASLGESAEQSARQNDIAVATLRDAMESLQNLSQDTENGLVTASEKVATIQTHALSAMSRGTTALHKEMEQNTDALAGRMEHMWQEFRRGVDEAAAHLDAQISLAQSGSSQLTEQFASHADQSAALAVQMQQLVDDVGERLSELDELVGGSTAGIGRTIDTIQAKLDGFAADVGSSNRSAQQLIQHSDALLLALDSVTRELDETLPLAFQRLDAHEASAEQAVARLKPLLEASELVAQSTLSHIQSAEKALQNNEATLSSHAAKQEVMTERLQSSMADTEVSLAQLLSDAERFADDTGAQMLGALHRVRETAHMVAEDARSNFARMTDDSRTTLESHGKSAVDEAFRSEMLAQLESIELASHRAVTAANSASDRLMARLTAIMEASEAVEIRTAEAEKAISSADRDSMAKQVGLLTEALKSTAIDMTKILSADISDQAWEGYLRGDRGVFARRAVKLLDNGESKEILRLYQQDKSFQASVNQFIHDFEAMLRLLMNARDGSAFSVTLLSSDIGKIYVALAQAIDRLRS